MNKSSSRGLVGLLVLAIFCCEIFGKDNQREENEKERSEIYKVKKIVLDLDFLPTPVFQDATEPRQRLHRTNRIQVFQPIDFESIGERWLSLEELHYALLDSKWHSDGSSKFFNRLLEPATLEEPASKSNISERVLEDFYKLLLASVSGHIFECSIPPIRQTVEQSEFNLESVNWSSIISQFNGTCFYRNEGWWTYEFCVGKHVKQYHLNPVTLEQEEVFYLGFPVQHDNNEEETQYHTATFSINQVDDYLIRMQYSNGSLCPLTGSPRNVTIDFVCPSTVAPDIQVSEFISSIREIGTCSYQLTLASNVLCNEFVFRNRPSDDVEVLCKVKDDSVWKDIKVTSLAEYTSSAWF